MMTFSDCLQGGAPNPSAGSASKEESGSRLRRSAARAGAAIAALALLPLLSGTASAAAPAVRVLLALGATVALAYVAIRFLGRRAAATPGERLRVVARTALTPRNGLALVEADGERYLLAFGEGFTQLLATKGAPASPPVGGAS